jgi:hypothetical protein
MLGILVCEAQGLLWVVPKCERRTKRAARIRLHCAAARVVGQRQLLISSAMSVH